MSHTPHSTPRCAGLRESTRTRVGSAVAVVLLLALANAVPLAARAAPSARDLMRKGDFAGAVPILRQSLERSPGAANVERDLGIALYKSGSAKDAVSSLQHASTTSTRDPVTWYFLGAAAEAAGDSELALRSYRRCESLGRPYAALVRARIAVLAHAQVARDIAQAIREEGSIGIERVPANAVAVPEFALAGGPDSLRPLCRGLAVVMTTDLRRVPDLVLVERERLPVLLSELKLTQASGAVEPATAPRLGKLIGARRFAQGGLLALEAGQLSLHGSVIDAQTSAVRLTGAPVQGALASVLDLEKRLVYEFLDTLDVPVTAGLRKAIGGPPTRSFEAFLAFSRGVALEDSGRVEAAAVAYRQALALDPRFKLAGERLEATQPPADGGRQAEQEFVAAATALPAGTGATERSTDALGFGPISGVVPAAPPLSASSRLGTRLITISISLP